MAARLAQRSWLLLGVAVLVAAGGVLMCRSQYSESVKRANEVAEAFVDAVERDGPMDAFTCIGDPARDALAGARAFRDCAHTEIEWRDVSMFFGDAPLLSVTVRCRGGRVWRFTVEDAESGCRAPFVVRL